MIELNLLPDVKQEFVHAQRLHRKIISAMILLIIVSVGLVALIAVNLYVVQSVHERIVDGDIKNHTKQLQEQDNLTRDLTVQNQLAALSDLHKDKSIYSRLFDYLLVLNPKAPNSIKISQLKVDSETKTITIDGSAMNYKAVGVFKDTLENAALTTSQGSEDSAVFTDVQLSDVGLGQDSFGANITTFKFILTYSDEAFARDTQNATVTVPNKNTTPSSQDSSVFGQTNSKENGN